MNRIDKKIKETIYGVKSNSLQIKDIDTRARTVSGYFAAFDTIDSDSDIIRKGAFSKSINEKGVNSTSNRKIAHLRNHDFDRQIGRLITLEEDDYGLFFVSSMGRSTEGNDAFLDYQDGILREHSIGFNYIQDKLKWVDDIRIEGGGYFEVTEVKLWEGSAVTFGANSLTPVVDVAKGESEYNTTLTKLSEITNSINNALKNGKGTDERIENLEIKFKQTQQLIKSLEAMKPSVKDTLKPEPKEKSSLLNLLLK